MRCWRPQPRPNEPWHVACCRYEKIAGGGTIAVGRLRAADRRSGRDGVHTHCRARACSMSGAPPPESRITSITSRSFRGSGRRTGAAAVGSRSHRGRGWGAVGVDIPPSWPARLVAVGSRPMAPPACGPSPAHPCHPGSSSRRHPSVLSRSANEPRTSMLGSMARGLGTGCRDVPRPRSASQRSLHPSGLSSRKRPVATRDCHRGRGLAGGKHWTCVGGGRSLPSQSLPLRARDD